MKRTIAGLVAVCLVASACVAAPTAASPSTDVPVLAGIQSPSAAPAMTVTPVPSATPSPTLAVTQPPTATPTKKATPRPTRPSPPASGVLGRRRSRPDQSDSDRGYREADRVLADWPDLHSHGHVLRRLTPARFGITRHLEVRSPLDLEVGHSERHCGPGHLPAHLQVGNSDPRHRPRLLVHRYWLDRNPPPSLSAAAVAG